MPSIHPTASTTAASHTLTTLKAEPSMQTLIVINVDGGATSEIYFTVATGDNEPVTAVAAADGTLVACAGAAAIPVDLGNVRRVKVSVVAASGTPKFALIAG